LDSLRIHAGRTGTRNTGSQRLAHPAHIPRHPKAVWLNREPEQLRPCRQSIAVIREIMESRMYPINIEGQERAMRYLSR
jgi:uncharacterized protein with von Willebrand factor type A (vWA) domain